MNNEIKIFSNEEFGNVRTVMINNEPYFAGRDIAEILGYDQPHKAIKRHCKRGMFQNVPHPQSPTKTIQMVFIPESDVYRLIINSKLPSAEKFENWVFDEVLPSIRKHGAYMTSTTLYEMLAKPENMISLLQNLKEEQEKNRKLQEENIILIEENQEKEIIIEEMKPKSIYCDKVLQSDGLITITQIAKDYGYSGKEFNKILHNLGIQYKQGNVWLLYAKYQNKGYTYSKTYVNENNKSFINTQWTQKGRLFLYEFLKECGILPLIEKENNEDND